MPRRKPKLVNWLIGLLDRKEFDDIGLQWEDRSDGLFWIPNARQKCKKWKPYYSAFIVEYVKMQGRYESDEKRHLPVWKGSLRNALDRMTRNMKVNDKSSPLPRKLYQIKEMAGDRRALTDSSASSTASMLIRCTVSSPECDIVADCLGNLNPDDLSPLLSDDVDWGNFLADSNEDEDDN